MDPVLIALLTRAATQLATQNPKAAANIAAVLAGRGSWEAPTLLVLRPLLQAAGKSVNDLLQPRAIGQAASEPGQQAQVNQGKGVATGPGLPTWPLRPETRVIGSQLQENPGAESMPNTPPSSPGTENGRPAVQPPLGVQPGGEETGRQTTSPFAPVLGAAQTIADRTQGPAGGNWSAATGIGLAGDDNGAVRFALQQAGLDPDRLGHFGTIIARALAPMILARRNTVGLTGTGNTGTIPQELADFTKMFTTKGVDAFGEAAKYGQGILSNPNLATYLSNINSGEDQGQFYQGLLPLLYGGANPLIQQAAADSSTRYLNQYRDAELQGGGVQPGGGIFSNWLDSQPNVDPFVRRIFGR